MTRLSVQCPICGRSFNVDAPGVAMPFCSSRCKLIDAARWLDEAYGFPLEQDDDGFAGDVDDRTTER